MLFNEKSNLGHPLKSSPEWWSTFSSILSSPRAHLPLRPPGLLSLLSVHASLSLAMAKVLISPLLFAVYGWQCVGWSLLLFKTIEISEATTQDKVGNGELREKRKNPIWKKCKWKGRSRKTHWQWRKHLLALKQKYDDVNGRKIW